MESGKKEWGQWGDIKGASPHIALPYYEARKEFLERRPTLKKTYRFLGDDLTLSQIAHMKEVMPEIRAAREKGKIAFYRDGRVVILEQHTT